MKYLLTFLLIWTGFLAADPGNSDDPDSHAAPRATQPAASSGSSDDDNFSALDRALDYQDPNQFKADLQKENIDLTEAIQKLEEKKAQTQNPAEMEHLDKLIQALREKETQIAQETLSPPGANSPNSGEDVGALSGSSTPSASSGIPSVSPVSATARQVDQVISLRANQIIDSMLKEAQYGPLSPERVQHYERQIGNLPTDIQKGVEPLLQTTRTQLERRAQRQQDLNPSNPFNLFPSSNPVETEMNALSGSYRQSVSQAQDRARDYLSVASTQATSTLFQSRNLAREAERFSSKATDANNAAADDFYQKLKDKKTVDTGEVDSEGNPIKVLPTGETAESLRGDFVKLAEAAQQRGLNPELQQKVESTFEQARDRFGEERVNNILAAAARGADISPFLPQGPENTQTRLELQELARTAATLKRVDDSVLSTAALGSQIIDEKQFKTFRNETGFQERAQLTSNVEALARNADDGVRKALRLMEEQGIITRAFGVMGPDAIARQIQVGTLGFAPNQWLPDSDPKLREQASQIQPVIEQMRLLAPQLARAQSPEEFGRVYDDIQKARRELEGRITRLQRTAEGYGANAQLTKTLAVTAGSIAAGSVTGGTATGIILAATASSTLRGGVEFIDGATSKKGVNWARVRNESILGAVDVIGGAAATKAANFTNTLLSQSLKNASPAVRNLAYVANYGLIEGGGSGALSGGIAAHFEGKSVLAGAGQGFLWGTLIGGGIRGAQLAASGGVSRVSASSSAKPTVLDSYPEGAFDAAQRIAKSRGVKVNDLSEAELHTIGQRELEIQALVREKGISPGEARVQLERMGLLLSGQNSFNKLAPRAGGKEESLHRVVSQVLSELPDNFHSLPYTQRLQLAQEQIQKSYRIDPSTPFVPELGKVEGTLLGTLSEAVANIRPVMTATARYRSVPLPQGGINSLQDAQDLFARDASGYVHTSTLEGARNFTAGAGQRAVFVYPKGADGFVINGEGAVFSEARALQGSLDPRRAQNFASNDWGVLPDGLEVSRFSREADGTTMIFLERRSVQTPQERLRAAVGSENVGASTLNGAGSGQEVVVGAFNSPFQRALDGLAERAADGTLGGGRSRSGMVEVYYPEVGDATSGVSKNLRRGKTPGPTHLHSDEANTAIAAGRARGEHGWHPPGQCGLCDAMEKAGVSASRSSGDSSVAFPVRDGFIYPQAVPQCKSCQTLGVEDLATRTQTEVLIAPPRATSSQELSPAWFREVWNASR